MMKRLRAAFFGGMALVFLCAPVQAFSPQSCAVRADDGRVVTLRLFKPEFAFSQPTREYGHAVLGDDEEYRGLKIAGFPASRRVTPPEGVDTSGLLPESVFEITLPEGRVFEDLQPRVFDWTSANFHVRAGVPTLGLNVVVVETDIARGATLAVYQVGCDGVEKVAATDPIGTAYRWLAPAGIADFNGDGQNDIAYVETPHLAGILRIVTLSKDGLVEIVEAVPGFSNHRIGDDFIVSEVRDCGDGLPELIMPTKGWSALMAVRWEAGKLISREIPGEVSPDGVKQAASCG